MTVNHDIKNLKYHMDLRLENIVCLRQRQLRCRLGVAQHTVCFDSLSHDVSDVYLSNPRDTRRNTHITLRVDLHLGHYVVESHILLPDGAAAFDGFDAFAQAVGLYDALVDGSLRDEHD